MILILNRFSTCERCHTGYLGHAGFLYSLIDTIIYIDLATESLCRLERDTFLQKWEFTVRTLILWLPESLDHYSWRKHATGFLMRFWELPCCSIFPFHKSVSSLSVFPLSAALCPFHISLPLETCNAVNHFSQLLATGWTGDSACCSSRGSRYVLILTSISVLTESGSLGSFLHMKIKIVFWLII